MPEDPSILDSTKVQFYFVFSVAWSLGAIISESDKTVFNRFLKELCTVEFGPSVFDSYYDLDQA